MPVSKNHSYRDRRIALGTKHGKERVVRPPFLAQLGAMLEVPADMDTDLLGTFTGEVERAVSPGETAFKKAAWAMSLTALPLGLASEGSFGPHPEIGFVPCDSEWMVFVDDDLGLRIAETLITTDTNFGHTVVQNADEAAPFVEEASFPSHALIVRPNQPKSGVKSLFKGVADRVALARAIRLCRADSLDDRVRIETDMRAHMNPTRQRAIQALAFKLARRIRERCAACGAPGWGLVGTLPGLPCEECRFPTKHHLKECFGCVSCDRREILPRADGRALSSVRHCDLCNP